MSVEDQATADERIPLLLQTPAALRFVSAEPLLGPVDLRVHLQRFLPDGFIAELAEGPYDPKSLSARVDWLIVGGESGPQARPADVAWIWSLKDQAAAAGVPCFVKQLGANVIGRNDAGFEGETPSSWPMDTDSEDVDRGRHWQGDLSRILLRNRKGSDPSEWPADLRVRSWPEV